MSFLSKPSFELEETQKASCESLRGEIQSEMKLQTPEMLQQYFPSFLERIRDLFLNATVQGLSDSVAVGL
jgi:hypothetical protein